MNDTPPNTANATTHMVTATGRATTAAGCTKASQFVAVTLPAGADTDPSDPVVTDAGAPLADLGGDETDVDFVAIDPCADALIGEFRLEKIANSLGEQLSGGERRRAEVARSLLAEPRHILFDEPFAGVDPIAVGELQRLIGALRDRGIGVLITDHAVREALGICTRAYILSSGTLLEAGTPAEIAASPRARAVYLGEKFRLEEGTEAR